MTEPAKTTRLRVATYNLRVPCDPAPNDWPNRAPRVARTLSACRFDIFGVQEAVDAQIEFLSKDAGLHWIGTGRERDLNGEYSAIFFRPERLACLGSHTFWLSETPSMPGLKSWGSACARICTFGLFRDNPSGKTFVLANTHLDHVSHLAMANGVRVILRHLEPYFPDFPIVLTGDFNTYPGTEPLEILSTKMWNARLAAEAPHAGPDGATYHGYQADPRDRKHYAPIDYIFVTPGIRVLRHEAVDDFERGLASSDHFALYADVEF